MFNSQLFLVPLHPQTKGMQKPHGALAQLDRTENPCVPGSIPGGTTPPFISPVSRYGGRVSFFILNDSDYGNSHWY